LEVHHDGVVVLSGGLIEELRYLRAEFDLGTLARGLIDREGDVLRTEGLTVAPVDARPSFDGQALVVGTELIAFSQPRDLFIGIRAVEVQRLVENTWAILVVCVGRIRVPQLVVHVLAVTPRPHQDELLVARDLRNLSRSRLRSRGWRGRRRSR